MGRQQPSDRPLAFISAPENFNADRIIPLPAATSTPPTCLRMIPHLEGHYLADSITGRLGTPRCSPVWS